MFFIFFKRKIEAFIDELFHFFKFLLPEKELIILDDLYPHPISVFRNIEFQAYLNSFDKVSIYSSGDALDAVHDNRNIGEVIRSYDKQVLQFTHHKLLKSKLIYSLFLNVTYGFLPYIERNRVPFVFTLYPGGGFYLNDKQSDERLRVIFGSSYFRKVIVTQKITRDYLLEKKMCEPGCIEFVYGVVCAPHIKSVWQDKLFYTKDKSTFDICFIANKNMEKGYDKGYDLFIDSVRDLCFTYSDVRIHVIGPYDESDYDVRGMKVQFHGFMNQNQFLTFFQDKDIILSPNRAFVLHPGAFDGFPTGSCTEASACGVAMFISDPLNLNVVYQDTLDCLLVENEVDWISDRLKYYHNNPDELYEMAYNGFNKTHSVYGVESQIRPRVELLKKELSRV
ncbi:glycosyltransferase family protein [Persicobacter psychrovividus]|uniref:LPS biosynthesis protein RfbU n=1 Tax=Persicobacter psychrovividus TaxID=387638 RepID=A0ABM7VCE5_9BACT|nr:LPS biosynthesis protein RfbU [Persicobacter psychrovividus]